MGEESYGVDYLRQRYSEEIVVELRETLPDGRPAAVRIRQPVSLVWIAAGRGFPIPSQGSGELGGLSEESYVYVRTVASRAVVSWRTPYRDVSESGEPGPWLERWDPVEIVSKPVRNGEISIEDFDRGDNVMRVWLALVKDLDAGGKLSGADKPRFRGDGSSDRSLASEGDTDETSRTPDRGPRRPRR